MANSFLLLLCLALNARAAQPGVLLPRVITLPPGASMLRFADVDGDGLADLLVIDPVERTLRNYHQRRTGFGSASDQTIPLPPQTVWVAPCDADAHPGLELLISTAAGLVYSRQDAGLFERERRPLLEAGQVFTNFDFPVLTLLSTNKPGTNDTIPVISARQVVPYHRNSAYEWHAGPALPLEPGPAVWSVSLDQWGDPWTLGPNPAHRLHVRQSFRAKPDQKREQEPENEAIRKVMAEMTRTGNGVTPQMERVDVDGDGRQDLVLWQPTGNPPLKTEVCVFLRGASQQLPERPTQVLHCRGFPIPIGSMYEGSPVHDLNGDGACELVLLDFKTSIVSASGVVEIFLSHGIDWALTIRTFQHGVFSGSPDAAVPVKGLLPSQYSAGWGYFILGDFNGDGRPDLLVRRTETQWNVFFSTTDRRWFAPEAALAFDVPTQGYMEIKDLNGDGLSDIVWHQPEDYRLSIFMTPVRQAKASTP